MLLNYFQLFLFSHLLTEGNKKMSKAVSAAQYGDTLSKLKSSYTTGPNSSYLGALVMTAVAAPLSEVLTTKQIQKKKDKVYMYKLAPLWKRLAAECYTDLHLFLFRILFTIACVRYFEFNFHNLIAPLTQMHSYYDKIFCFLLKNGLGENLDAFDYEKYLHRMTDLLPEFKSDAQAWLWLLTVHFWTIFTHFAMIDSFFQTIICISEVSHLQFACCDQFSTFLFPFSFSLCDVWTQTHVDQEDEILERNAWA